MLSQRRAISIHTYGIRHMGVRRRKTRGCGLGDPTLDHVAARSAELGPQGATVAAILMIGARTHPPANHKQPTLPRARLSAPKNRIRSGANDRPAPYAALHHVSRSQKPATGKQFWASCVLNCFWISAVMHQLFLIKSIHVYYPLSLNVSQFHFIAESKQNYN